MRHVAAVSILALAGCAPGQGGVELAVNSDGSAIAGIAGFNLDLQNGSDHTTAHEAIPGAPITIPPAKTLALTFDKDRKGTVMITVTAVDAQGAPLGQGSVSVDVEPSAVAQAMVMLHAGASPGDGMAPADLGGADLASPDLEAPDLQAPDLQPVPDLTFVCHINSDCVNPLQPLCDQASGMCVSCLPADADAGTNDSCRMGEACIKSNGVYGCVPGCKVDADCQGDGGPARSCCNHLCVDPAADSNNCGACGKQCQDGELCCLATCINPIRDVKNCGGCGVACSAANVASWACVASQCSITKCADGFADCDASAGDGCEQPVSSDIKNCGGCRVVCPANHNSPVCNTGTCGLGTCDTGFADCDGNAGNGCEQDVAGDPNNCGGCKVVCSNVNNTPTCGKGVCVKACGPGWDNCDNTPPSIRMNGCNVNTNTSVNACGACGFACNGANDTPQCANGACTSLCNAGYDNCDGTRQKNGCNVNKNSDANNCGACGLVCNGTNDTPQCSNGVCTSPCNAGYDNCDGTRQRNGCNVNKNTDPANCGACGLVCNGTNDTPRCSNGACTSPCNAGYDNCDNTRQRNGCNVNKNTDPANCGACGVACNGTNDIPQCSNGVCSSLCNAGYDNCDNTRQKSGCNVNKNTDPANCGGCGVACNGTNDTPQCSNGVCISPCNVGYDNCDNTRQKNGCNVNKNTDLANCGGCGVACNGANDTPQCSNGACTSPCNVGYDNCDNTRQKNGCNVNKNTDANNCGACGHACAFLNGTPLCVNGACGTGICSTGWANCDGSPANGCEIFTTTDPKNCGACGHDCLGGVCQNGQCQPIVLASGTYPWGVAVDNTNVYFTDATLGTVSKCAIGGCNKAPTVIAAGLNWPGNLALYGSSLYWASSPGVGSCGVGCNNNATVISNPPAFGIAADKAGVYWNTAQVSGNISQCTTAPNCYSPLILASSQADSDYLAVDLLNVYWSTASGVAKCQKGVQCGPNAHVLVSGLADPPVGLVSDGVYIYYIDSTTREIMTCSTAGCNNAPAVFVFGANAAALTLDANNVYWIGATNAYSCPLGATCAQQKMLAAAQFTYGQMTNDANALYWADNTDRTVKKLAK